MVFICFLRNTGILGGRESPKMAQDGPEMAPRWPKMAPGWAQEGPRMAQEGPKKRPGWPKVAPRWTKMAQKVDLGRQRLKHQQRSGSPGGMRRGPLA